MLRGVCFAVFSRASQHVWGVDHFTCGARISRLRPPTCPPPASVSPPDTLRLSPRLTHGVLQSTHRPALPSPSLCLARGGPSPGWTWALRPRSSSSTGCRSMTLWALSRFPTPSRCSCESTPPHRSCFAAGRVRVPGAVGTLCTGTLHWHCLRWHCCWWNAWWNIVGGTLCTGTLHGHCFPTTVTVFQQL